MRELFRRNFYSIDQKDSRNRKDDNRKFLNLWRSMVWNWKQDGRISHGDQLLYTGRKGNRKIYCLSRTQSKRRMGRLKAIGSDRTFTPQAEKSQLRFIMPEERQAVPWPECSRSPFCSPGSQVCRKHPENWRSGNPYSGRAIRWLCKKSQSSRIWCSRSAWSARISGRRFRIPVF